jgi:hypothetical protein
MELRLQLLPSSAGGRKQQQQQQQQQQASVAQNITRTHAP